MRSWVCVFTLLIRTPVWSAWSAEGFRPFLPWRRLSSSSAAFTCALSTTKRASKRPGASPDSSATGKPSSTSEEHAGFWLQSEPPEVGLSARRPLEEISPHYRRDRRDVNNPLPSDVSGLKSALRDRYHAARGNRDNATVSMLDEQLRDQYGVVVYDSPPVWTTIVDDPPDWLRRKRESRKLRDQHDRYGPTGHEYRQRGNLDPLFSDLDLPDIHRLLARRTGLRADGRFEMADAVKLELSIHGIRALDDSLEFHSVGSSSSSGSIRPDHEEETDRIQYEYLYEEDVVRSKGWGDDTTPHRFRVQQLVRQRTEELAIGDHSSVAHLDLELFRAYRVRVDDLSRKWFVVESNDASNDSVDESLVRAVQAQVEAKNAVDESSSRPFALPIVTLSSFQPCASSATMVPEYRLSSSSLSPLPPYVARRVVDMVRERSLRREEGKFHEADALRRELWHTYHVGINDRLRQFSVGGVFDDSEDAAK